MKDEEREEKRICFLTVYRTDQQYGGPEEGGWNYTTYEMVASVPFMGTARIWKTKQEDTDLYGGGYDPDNMDDCADGPFLTHGEVTAWENELAVEAEKNRLTGLYADSKGRMKHFSIYEEVFQGEMARLTRRRYC